MGTALRLNSFGSPEEALLLAASRGDPSREVIKRLMGGRIDWSHLTRLAVQSHATPSLWEVVSAYPNLPGEASTLQSYAVVDGFRRYHIRSLVARTVNELRDAGIEVLALKGAALLVGGVSKPTQRTMSDIDLLVVTGSPETAWRECLSRGWTLVDQAWTEERYRGHHHLPPLVDPDGIEVGLELHRSLLLGVERLGIDVPALIARSHLVRVGDVPVRVPSVEDLLLHTCLHFAWSNKLQRGAWRAYADAHAIIADPAFNWDRFLGLVPSPLARQCCYWTLRLGASVADLTVPVEVLHRLDPSSGGWLGELLARHFASQMADPEAESPVSERARRWFWFAAMREEFSSDTATSIWMEGALEATGEGRTTMRAPRGVLRAAFSTCAYLARLATRG